MKNLKLIMMLLALTFQFSCQTEEIIAEKIVAKPKKTPLPYGVPSAATDSYEFDKTTYYHNDILITDTTAIKKMLGDASLIHIDGNRRDICVTDTERNVFENKNFKSNSTEKLAVLTDDRYMHYFYEIARNEKSYNSNVNTGLKHVYYINFVGPHTLTAIKTIEWHRAIFKNFSTEPETSNLDVLQSNTSWTKLQSFLVNTRISGSLSYAGIDYNGTDYELNMNNTTKTKRLVSIISNNGKKITVIVPSQKMVMLSGHSFYEYGAGGSVTGGYHVNFFGGSYDFIIKYVSSSWIQ